MSKKAIRVFSRKFKLEIVRRMLAGENVSALAREVKVLRKACMSGASASDPVGLRRCAAVADHPRPR